MSVSIALKNGSQFDPKKRHKTWRSPNVPCPFLLCKKSHHHEREKRKAIAPPFDVRNQITLLPLQELKALALHVAHR